MYSVFCIRPTQRHSPHCFFPSFHPDPAKRTRRFFLPFSSLLPLRLHPDLAALTLTISTPQRSPRPVSHAMCGPSLLLARMMRHIPCLGATVSAQQCTSSLRPATCVGGYQGQARVFSLIPGKANRHKRRLCCPDFACTCPRSPQPGTQSQSPPAMPSLLPY